MKVIGVDENGFGPILGPLVVTGVLDEYAKGNFKDSKELWQMGGFERVKKEAERLIREKGLKLILKRGDMCKACFNTVERMNRGEGNIVSYPICPDDFNKRLRELKSKNLVNLEGFRKVMEELGSADIVIAGRVGNTKRYPKYVKWLGKTLREEDEISEYLTLLGGRIVKIIFEKDADTKYLPVANASIVGKYIREICLRDFLDFLGLGGISGYHDEPTLKMLPEVKRRAKEVGFPEDCIMRLK